jgi:acetyltransferase-like isoleucine patch superfamily enzyme
MKNALLLLISLFPYPVKNLCYRLLGYKIGKRVKIGFLTIIDLGRSAQIGSGCRIGSICYVKAASFHLGTNSRISSFTYIQAPKISIGRDVKVSNFVAIRSGHVSKESELIVGDLVHIFPFVNIDCSRRVEIQREAGIGPYCDIYTHASYKSVLDGYSVSYGDVLIGEQVELTYRVFVAPGVVIGNNAICALGSYVNKDVPPDVLVAGTPAVVKRTADQIHAGHENLSIRKTLDNIIESYQVNVHLITGRHPLKTKIYVEEQAFLDTDGMAYIIYDTNEIVSNAKHYALFDVTAQICLNKGVNIKDFNGLRKYLSRYGIRFISEA